MSKRIEKLADEAIARLDAEDHFSMTEIGSWRVDDRIALMNSIRDEIKDAYSQALEDAAQLALTPSDAAEIRALADRED